MVATQYLKKITELYTGDGALYMLFLNRICKNLLEWSRIRSDHLQGLPALPPYDSRSLESDSQALALEFGDSAQLSRALRFHGIWLI